MSTGSIRNLIIARAVSVEPLARALYRDPLDAAGRSFARPADRWQKTATHLGRATTFTNQEKPR
jgi:hypothetical protein